MSVNLVKGQKISLSKESQSLSNVLVGLGWDVNNSLLGWQFDLDAHAFLKDKNGKIVEHVYYRHLKFKDIVVHTGDNLTGAGDGDDEQIKVNLDKVPTEVNSILFSVIIFKGVSRKQYFKKVKNAFIHIDIDGKEVCRYRLNEDFDKEVEVEVGEIYRYNGEWKFNALGVGYTSEVVRKYMK